MHLSANHRALVFDRRTHAGSIVGAICFSRNVQNVDHVNPAQENTLHGVNNNTLQQRWNLYFIPLYKYTLRTGIELKFGVLTTIII